MTMSHNSLQAKPTLGETLKVNQGNFNSMMKAIIKESSKFAPTLERVEDEVKKIHDENRVQFDKLDSRLKTGIQKKIAKIMK